MPESSAHIAVDLGSESGRVMLGVLHGERVTMQLCHRFAHAPIESQGQLHWNLESIWREVRDGLAIAVKRASEAGIIPSSVGVDSWGVDYAMLSAEGELSTPPRCYRDPSFALEYQRVAERMGAEELYRNCLLYTSPSPRDLSTSRMPSSA